MKKAKKITMKKQGKGILFSSLSIPNELMKIQKKANTEKALQIKELKEEVNLLKKKNAWLLTRVEKLLCQMEVKK